LQSLSRISTLEALDLNESVDETPVEALDLATPNEVIIPEATKDSLDGALPGTKHLPCSRTIAETVTRASVELQRERFQENCWMDQNVWSA